MDLQEFRWLLTPEGQAVLAAATGSDLSEPGLLATTTRLRAKYPAAPVAAAVTQARLRVRARVKFGADADVMYFTQAGLEQSTRAGVAGYRARRFVAHLGYGPSENHDHATSEYRGHETSERSSGGHPGGADVLELGCGIGGDLIARARTGATGEGVERDPLTAEVARANLAALGLDGRASVRVGDALEADPAGHAAVFADPGRRTSRGRVFDPRSYEPPLDEVLALAVRAPAACVKVAPGIPYEALWEGGDGAPLTGAPVEAEWISEGGEVKEAALWLGGLAGDVRRRATLLAPDGSGTAVATLTPEPGLGEPDVRPWGRYLYEPDGAVIRAHLVAEAAARVGGWLADPRIAYLTSDTLVATPLAAAYEIEAVLPFSVKRLRAELRRRAPAVLTIKKRGSAVDVDRLRRDLGFGRRREGSGATVLVLTRVGSDPIALLASPAR